ncbi:Ldh family oxidoreductase [Rhizobiales bacterium RZME27]|uniref:Ldh family oxidoreductase n=1 Tax=Endobacterium cereale TaxID=2663029 RepID=A0A6A8AIC1_9HYPH|nr:Ldh family oxidoreductase [Endobacterium cereale]MEB2844118.1 Ldh family oxidoreductase [Endobacterium cereale]MQY48531.1 Ldh family oxidoreductase [Endobacterium cereale]
MTEPRYAAADLLALARALFTNAGLEADKAEAVATYLVEADLMGHSTHGLALAGWYLQGIADGVVTRTGTYEVVSDKGPAVCWQGNRLPGAWLTSKAVKLATERATKFGTATVVIANSHHIGALAAYLELATSKNMMVSVASSSPSGGQVAPFGGLKGVYTPNPVAYGIPTPDGPMLIDISASITTNNMSQRLIREGRQYEHDWLMDAEGNPSRDPKVLDQGGSLLPTGGFDHGQKGYGMALQVEAITQGLAGYGRADAPKGTNAAVTVQVWDPEAFGGRDAFLRQTGWLADACHATPPRPGVSRVRLPGEAALGRKKTALADGVQLYPTIIGSIEPHAERLGVAMPKPI